MYTQSVACCHDRVNFPLYSRARRYRDHWYSVLLSWHPLKGISRLFWHCSINIRCFVSRHFKICHGWYFSSCQWSRPNTRLPAVCFKRPRLGASVLLPCWTGELSYANSNTADFGSLWLLILPSFLLKWWDHVVPAWFTSCSTSCVHINRGILWSVFCFCRITDIRTKGPKLKTMNSECLMQWPVA